MRTAVDYSEQKPHLIDEVILERRAIIPEISEYLHSTIKQLRPLKYIIDDVFNSEEVFELLNKSLPEGPIAGQKLFFITDIIRLCTLFYNMKKNKKMKVQIEIVTTDRCRIFHEDYYRQRLLCTYLGPGTEWLDHSNVNRDALGKGCNENIVKDFSKINRSQEFEVILLKGVKYAQERSVIHRSPPIEKDKRTRVLLKIDE